MITSDKIRGTMGKVEMEIALVAMVHIWLEVPGNEFNLESVRLNFRKLRITSEQMPSELAKEGLNLLVYAMWAYKNKDKDLYRPEQCLAHRLMDIMTKKRLLQ